MAYTVYDNNRVVLREYTYSSSRVPDSFDGFRICLVTDYHNEDNYEKVYEAVEKADADIICIGGDFVDMNTEDFTNAREFAKRLAAIGDVYYTFGNHEAWSTTYNDTEEPIVVSELADTGVKFLNDEVVSIKRDGEVINLVGYGDSIYDDIDGNFEKKAKKKLKELYSTLDKDVFSVLVFHRAQYFDMTSAIGYDMVLSGHLHGGQINIGIVRDYILNKYFGTAEYVKGQYNKNGSVMYICGGTSKKNGIYRVLNTPEVVVVELQAE